MILETLELVIRIAGGIAVGVMAVVIIAGLWAARKQRVEREVGRDTSFLRSGWFLAFGIVLAVVVFWLLWRPLPVRLSEPVRWLLLVVGSLLFFPGIGLIIWGRLTLAEMYNVSSGMGVQVFEGHRLVTSGPFRYVRHPMYLGNALWVIGALLIYQNWAALLLVASILNMSVRAKKEEQALIETFGDEYREYMRWTPAFFPAIKKRTAPMK